VDRNEIIGGILFSAVLPRILLKNVYISMSTGAWNTASDCEAGFFDWSTAVIYD
jgi:hypothetical protein